MQNELAEVAGLEAGFTSVTNERSNTFQLGNVLLAVECMYNMHLFIYARGKKKILSATKTEEENMEFI